jgi:hypothetical protein
LRIRNLRDFRRRGFGSDGRGTLRWPSRAILCFLTRCSGVFEKVFVETIERLIVCLSCFHRFVPSEGACVSR